MLRNGLLRNINAFLLCLCIAAATLTACTEGTEYHNYKKISHEGWEQRDTLVFHIDSIKSKGYYHTYLCMRTNPDFPFRYITLIAEQTTLPGKQRGYVRKTFEVVSKHGTQTGKGLTYHTYEIPVFVEYLENGDSLRIAVRHDMVRESMQGIMDVGIKLKKE